MSVSQITKYMITEKADEILAEYIADDAYLGDALCDCFTEVRALLSADSIDDKLSAVDAFKAKLTLQIKRPDAINAEAWDFLANQVARG